MLKPGEITGLPWSDIQWGAHVKRSRSHAWMQYGSALRYPACNTVDPQLSWPMPAEVRCLSCVRRMADIASAYEDVRKTVALSHPHSVTFAQLQFRLPGMRHDQTADHVIARLKAEKLVFATESRGGRERYTARAELRRLYGVGWRF